LTWQIEFSETSEKQLKKLDHQVQKNILKYLEKRIKTDEDPKRYGDPLRDSLAGLWKYRIGDHRIICEIQEKKIVVLVLRVGHRNKVYGGALKMQITTEEALEMTIAKGMEAKIHPLNIEFLQKLIGTNVSIPSNRGITSNKKGLQKFGEGDVVDLLI
jgi:mRNA interferase RelE/StbE